MDTTLRHSATENPLATTSDHVTLSVAIPTFGRESVLIDTVDMLLKQQPAADEILIIDQTPRHEPETDIRLESWNREGSIRWLRLSQPSITAAMNHALLQANSDLVLFLDDDIRPEPGLIAGHVAAHASSEVWAVVGQVLQPGQVPESVDRDAGAPKSLTVDLDFPFNGTTPSLVRNCMAGNLSVKRHKAIRVGGFDENYCFVAYRFETDFARRIWDAGGKVLYEPNAAIHHLRVARGGTRQYANHLTTARPDHSVGDYYFSMKHAHGQERLAYIGKRLFRSFSTRFHLRRPWWIPVTLVAELRGLLLAMKLARRGSRLLSTTTPPCETSSEHLPITNH